MASKLRAAALVTDAGDAAIIANGKLPRILERITGAEELGTLFVPAGKRVNARRRWIGAAAKTVGTIIVDDGAARAILKSRKSLLAIGITAVRGSFPAQQVVDIRAPGGQIIAKGRVNQSSAQIRKIKGLKSSQLKKLLNPNSPQEVIHADHLAIKHPDKA
jgi:glutamate 5-kinase